MRARRQPTPLDPAPRVSAVFDWHLAPGYVAFFPFDPVADGRVSDSTSVVELADALNRLRYTFILVEPRCANFDFIGERIVTFDVRAPANTPTVDYTQFPWGDSATVQLFDRFSHEWAATGAVTEVYWHPKRATGRVGIHIRQFSDSFRWAAEGRSAGLR